MYVGDGGLTMNDGIVGEEGVDGGLEQVGGAGVPNEEQFYPFGFQGVQEAKKEVQELKAQPILSNGISGLESDQPYS